MFDHAKWLKDWTTVACHVYDSNVSCGNSCCYAKDVPSANSKGFMGTLPKPIGMM